MKIVNIILLLLLQLSLFPVGKLDVAEEDWSCGKRGCSDLSYTCKNIYISSLASKKHQ